MAQHTSPPARFCFWSAIVAVVWAGCSATTSDPRDGSVLDSNSRDAAALMSDATASDASEPDSSEPRRLRVLFVGNSYTRYNDLPEIVREIGATEPGAVTIELDSVLVDGATLNDHYTTTGARERIRDGHFDVVVIQGQSTEPLNRDSGFSFRGREFAADVVAAGARLVWFVTWARRAGHPDYARPSLRDPEYMTDQLVLAYGAAGGAPDGGLALVAYAFQIAIAEHPEIDLYDPDGSHPSAAGSVLAGCVISQMITGSTPHAPSPAPAGISQERAESLCAIAPRVACLGESTFCAGVCRDLVGDSLNCGACGNVCAGDLPCRDARCQCGEATLSACPGRVCSDLSRDPRNCGACGVRCDFEQMCESGRCECPPHTGHQVHISELTDLRAGCVRGSETWQPECFAAATEYCARSSCFNAAIAPVTACSFRPFLDFTCVDADVRTTTYSALAVLVPECASRDVAARQPCMNAIHRFCVAGGAVSGFGPVGGDATSLEIACLPSATIVRTSYAELGTYNAGCGAECDVILTRDGGECAFVSHAFCVASGYLSGFGPIEATGDSATVVCVDR